MTSTVDLLRTRFLAGEIRRYLLIGLCNTVLGLTLIIVLHLILGLSVFLANAIGYGCGLVLSFFLNRKWTFRHGGSLGTSAVLFGIVVGLAFVANLAAISGLQAAGMSYPFAQSIGTILYSVALFIGLKYVVFADRRGYRHETPPN